ncbi:hypothetical protein M3Y99_00601800 [Aphelenchoides fujianensis]|nr:hypothetical protein M3Y99_00601800 [Aphelenchoides fujianensis]
MASTTTAKGAAGDAAKPKPKKAAIRAPPPRKREQPPSFAPSEFPHAPAASKPPLLVKPPEKPLQPIHSTVEKPPLPQALQPFQPLPLPIHVVEPLKVPSAPQKRAHTFAFPVPFFAKPPIAKAPADVAAASPPPIAYDEPPAKLRKEESDAKWVTDENIDLLELVRENESRRWARWTDFEGRKAGAPLYPHLLVVEAKKPAAPNGQQASGKPHGKPPFGGNGGGVQKKKFRQPRARVVLLPPPPTAPLLLDQSSVQPAVQPTVQPTVQPSGEQTTTKPPALQLPAAPAAQPFGHVKPPQTPQKPFVPRCSPYVYDHIY